MYLGYILSWAHPLANHTTVGPKCHHVTAAHASPNGLETSILLSDFALQHFAPSTSESLLGRVAQTRSPRLGSAVFWRVMQQVMFLCLSIALTMVHLIPSSSNQPTYDYTKVLCKIVSISRRKCKSAGQVQHLANLAGLAKSEKKYSEAARLYLKVFPYQITKYLGFTLCNHLFIAQIF
jgi:hypothetical protein